MGIKKGKILKTALERVDRPITPRTITINEDDGSCPKCDREKIDYKKLFHDNGGDEEFSVVCQFCGEKFTILRRVIVAEYSVKEKA